MLPMDHKNVATSNKQEKKLWGISNIVALSKQNCGRKSTQEFEEIIINAFSNGRFNAPGLVPVGPCLNPALMTITKFHISPNVSLKFCSF